MTHSYFVKIFKWIHVAWDPPHRAKPFSLSYETRHYLWRIERYVDGNSWACAQLLLGIPCSAGFNYTVFHFPGPNILVTSEKLFRHCESTSVALPRRRGFRALKCKLNLITTTLSLHYWYTQPGIRNMFHILWAVISNSATSTKTNFPISVFLHLSDVITFVLQDGTKRS